MHLPVVWVKMVPCIRSLTRSSHQSLVWRQKTELHFMHRGGKYIKPTEVFGPGVFYQQ